MSKEEELRAKIKLLEEKITTLESTTVLYRKRPRFKHDCPFCGGTWDGFKEKVKECYLCKHILPEDAETFSKGSLTNKVICERVDALVKEKGQVINEVRNDNPKLRKRFTFTAKEGKIEFKKELGGVLVETKVVDSSYEIMKDWGLEKFLDNIS